VRSFVIGVFMLCLILRAVPVRAESEQGFSPSGALRSTFEIIEEVATYPLKLALAGAIGVYNVFNKDNKACYYEITNDPYPTALEAGKKE